MAKVLLVGCGDLGTEIAVNLHHAGHEVIGVRKSNKPLPFAMTTLQMDVTQANLLSDLTFMHPHIVIYCIAATAQTDENYYQHYVAGLKHVLATQKQNKQLEHVFFVSSTRVYGQHTQDTIDEMTPAIPDDFGGNRLLEAEYLLNDLDCKHTVLRLSGIYGPGRLYLVNMARDFSRWPEHLQWSNRIHRDDAAAFVSHLIDLRQRQSLSACYLVTDDQPASQYEVLAWLAQHMGLEVTCKMPSNIIHGKRLSNRLLQATGFRLKYPSYKQGYASLLASMS
jgi:nucleoside-diphosphate-sugar epimerase